MLSVQNYQLSPRISFKADEKDNKPFKTNAGLKSSVVMAATAIVREYIESGRMNSEFKVLSNTSQGLKNNKWIQWASTFLSLLGYVSVGALVDRSKNKENKKLSDDINQFGKTEALKMNKKAELTRNENPYNSSYTGVKAGALAGMAVWTILSLVTRNTKSFKDLFSFLPAFALEGAIVGLLADVCSNWAAKKHADK